MRSIVWTYSYSGLRLGSHVIVTETRFWTVFAGKTEVDLDGSARLSATQTMRISVVANRCGLEPIQQGC